MNRLSVIIPVFNQWEFTRACLHSLREYTPGTFYQVIVVDNGSTDETPVECPQLLAQLFSDQGLYLKQGANLGFGAACNAGAKASDSEHLFFLNNDTEVTQGWLEPLFKSLAGDPRLGAVSPLLLYPDTRRVQHLGVAFDPNLHPMHLFEGFPEHHPATQRPRTLQAISAAALFMPRDLFLDAEGFYTGFVNGSEDLDLCCRLGKKGMRMACEPRSVVLHHTSRTEGRYAHVAANAALLDQRCRGCFSSDLLRFACQEGYEILLTPWLEPYLQAENTAPWTGQQDALPEFLLEHPLNESGYTVLVKHLESTGEQEEALVWQELLAGFVPRMLHFASAARLAAATDRHDRAQRWTDRLSHVRDKVGSKEELTRRAQENLDWYQQSGETELATLYQAWLDRLVFEELALPTFKVLPGTSE